LAPCQAFYTFVQNIKSKEAEKKVFFPEKLLHSYLLLEDAQYFYTFVQNIKIATTQNLSPQALVLFPVCVFSLYFLSENSK
jgi:hypothetical protein